MNPIALTIQEAEQMFLSTSWNITVKCMEWNREHECKTFTEAKEFFTWVPMDDINISEEKTEEQKLTLWEELVWKTFNPGWMQEVTEIKELFAKAIDLVAIDFWMQDPQSAEKTMLMQRATELCIEAQMMCVKAITYKY